MLTPVHTALPRSASLSRTRAALAGVSFSSALLISSIGFAQAPPPPAAPPPAAVPTAAPTTVAPTDPNALPPPPAAPPPTAATPPPGYTPQTPPNGYAPPPGYGPPPNYGQQPGYGPPPGYAPPGYGPPPGDYGQTPPGYGPMPQGYPPYYGYGPYYGPPAGPPPPRYQRHNSGMMIGGVLLTTGGILGTLIGAAVTTTARDQINIYCDQGFGPTVCETRADETQLAGGIATLVIGVVAIGVGIPLWVIGGKREPVKEQPADQPAGQPAPQVPPQAPATSFHLVVGPSSAALRATF